VRSLDQRILDDEALPTPRHVPSATADMRLTGRAWMPIVDLARAYRQVYLVDPAGLGLVSAGRLATARALGREIRHTSGQQYAVGIKVSGGLLRECYPARLTHTALRGGRHCPPHGLHGQHLSLPHRPGRPRPADLNRQNRSPAWFLSFNPGWPARWPEWRVCGR
jgi:hypothetical protein